MSNTFLRKATLQDVDLIFEWANDEDDRRFSFNTEKIVYEDHCKWYQRKIDSEDTDIYILLSDDIPIGQCRLDFDDEGALISYFIDKRFRKKGYGKLLLRMIADVTKSEHPSIKRLNAQVKAENIGSKKVFRALGYEEKECGNINEYSLAL